MDDTLLLSGRISYFFWWLSLLMQKTGRKLQRKNTRLISELRDYENVVVLTGRDDKESRFTEAQLRKAGVNFTTLVCCPRRELIDEWKISVVQNLRLKGDVEWIDDIFEEGVPKALERSLPNLTIRGPLGKLAKRPRSLKSNRSSELESI